MKGIWLGLALALSGLGCAHTKTTDATSVSEPPKGASPPSDRPPAKVHQGAETSGGIPVASSPEGLLAPGGEQEIRDKLVDGGYLKKGDDGQSTTSALRKFQKDKDLPETGIPDHQTVRALGLDPQRVFKHADVQK